MIVNSASMRKIAFSVYRVRKSENPSLPRLQMWQFQFRSEKRIFHKIFTLFAHISIRSATEFLFLEKNRKFPSISRVQMWQFQFRSEKRISHKIFTPFAHISIRSATEFLYLEKTTKA